MTYLAAVIEEMNMQSEMSNSVGEQLANPIRSVAVGAVRMVTINVVVVFGNFAMRLSNDIPKIITVRDSTSNCIDD